MTPLQKEELRHAVIEVLATREGSALPVTAIRRRIEQNNVLDIKLTDDDVGAALMFLAGLNPPLISFTHDTLGSTQYAQATSPGVLAWERGTLK